MRTFLLCLCLLIFSFSRAQYQPPVFTDPQRLEKIKKTLPLVDSLYRVHARNNNFPGIAYGIVVDGQLIHSGAYGYADPYKKIPATTSTLFRVASMSKSFTALAILQLRDQGKLKLDDPVSLYIPEIGSSQLLTTDAAPITIRHLLTHAAGFPEDNPWGDRQLADSREELLELIKKGISFSTVPGLYYEYSNLGFALLGMIIENVSGEAFDLFTRKNILEPLGMKKTTWEYREINENQLAKGYRYSGKKWKEEALLSHGSWGAMGGLLSSVEEFSKYMILHMEAWPPRDGKENGILKRSSLREMHQPANISVFNPQFRYPGGRPCGIMSAYAYGLGWTLDCEGRIYVAHSGGLPGYGSQWRFMPEYGIGVIGMANRTYSGFSNINYQVLDTIIRLAGLKPRQLPPSPILQKRKMELMSFLPHWKNAEQSQIFAENFFPDNPVAELRANHQPLFEKIGPIISIGELEAWNQLRGRFLVTGEKGKLWVYFTLTQESEPRIQEMGVREEE